MSLLHVSICITLLSFLLLSLILTSEELNTSGKRKFSSAQSSWRLFCNGVPSTDYSITTLTYVQSILYYENTKFCIYSNYMYMYHVKFIVNV